MNVAIKIVIKHEPDHVTPSTRKSRHYFADSGGRSVGIVRLRTKATEFF
jgi:hypothetical protein